MIDVESKKLESLGEELSEIKENVNMHRKLVGRFIFDNEFLYKITAFCLIASSISVISFVGYLAYIAYRLDLFTQIDNAIRLLGR